MSSALAGHPAKFSLHKLVGSGDRIGLFTLPFLVAGLLLNLAYPTVFAVGGPPTALAVASVVVSSVGAVIWAWSVKLIVTRVPRGELITSGPYALVEHPLYTTVAFLVLPWLGFLVDTWLGAVVGVAMYLGARMFAPPKRRRWSIPSAPPGRSTPIRCGFRGCEPDQGGGLASTRQLGTSRPTDCWLWSLLSAV